MNPHYFRFPLVSRWEANSIHAAVGITTHGFPRWEAVHILRGDI
jgi:hypothetical protein